MKREDLQQYLETAKPKIENAIAQSIKSSDGNVALQLNIRLCYSVADEDMQHPATSITEAIEALFESLNSDYTYMPEACIDGYAANIGSPSSFEAFVIDPDSDEIIVEITPTGRADAKVGCNVFTKERPHPQA